MMLFAHIYDGFDAASHAREERNSSLTNDCMQVRGSKLLSCHAGHQEDGRCRIRGKSEESVACRQGSTQVRESTLALKLRADITSSPKEGYQWPHKRTDVLQI